LVKPKTSPIRCLYRHRNRRNQTYFLRDAPVEHVRKSVLSPAAVVSNRSFGRVTRPVSLMMAGSGLYGSRRAHCAPPTVRTATSSRTGTVPAAPPHPASTTCGSSARGRPLGGRLSRL
jgi:hypothetical protein